MNHDRNTTMEKLREVVNEIIHIIENEKREIDNRELIDLSQKCVQTKNGKRTLTSTTK
jgi:signal transduction histidine kinase